MEEQVKNQDFMPKAQVEIMLEGIRSDFKVFGEKLEGIDVRLMNVEEKVDLILEDMDGMKSNIVDIKNELKVKAGKEVTDDHENRIVKLEKATLVTG